MEQSSKMINLNVKIDRIICSSNAVFKARRSLRTGNFFPFHIPTSELFFLIK